MTAPSYFGNGANAAGTNPGAAAPASTQADDISIVFVVTANDPVSTPAGYTVIPGFPLEGGGNTGGAPWLDPGGDHAVRAYGFWKRLTGAGGTVSFSGIAHNGGHVVQAIIRGCVAAGDPFESVNPSSGESGWLPGSTTARTIPGGTTLTPDTLVLEFIADSATGRLVTSWTNADLTSLTERLDPNNGSCGNPHFATGTKAAAGAFAATTLVVGTNQDGTWVGASVVLKSQAAASLARSVGVII